jgi:hypothetical protein
MFNNNNKEFVYVKSDTNANDIYDVRRAIKIVLDGTETIDARQEAEKYLDIAFKDHFEQNVHQIVFKCLVDDDRDDEQRAARVFASKMCLLYARKARNCETSEQVKNCLIALVAFSTREKLLNAKKFGRQCSEFMALACASALIKCVDIEAEVIIERALEMFAPNIDNNNSDDDDDSSLLVFLKAFGETVKCKQLGCVRPERRTECEIAASNSCRFVLKIIEESYATYSYDTIIKSRKQKSQEEEAHYFSLLFEICQIWISEINRTCGDELFQGRQGGLVELALKIATSNGESTVQTNAMSFLSSLLEVATNTNREQLGNVLMYISQVACSRESDKSAQNRALEMMIAAAQGALNKGGDDQELVAFVLDASSKTLLVQPETPSLCFDVWLKLTSSSASAFDLDHETTKKYIPNAEVSIDCLAMYLLENFRKNPLEMESIREEIGDSVREVISAIGTNPLLPVLTRGLKDPNMYLGYVLVFQILSYRMKNNYSADDDWPEENHFVNAIQAIVDTLHSELTREAVCWSFVGIAKDISISKKLSAYCLKALCEVLNITRDPVHARGAATAIMRICDCQKNANVFSEEDFQYLPQLLERVYCENLVTPTLNHDLRIGQEPTNTVVLRAALRTNGNSPESCKRLFQKTYENAKHAMMSPSVSEQEIGQVLVDVSVAFCALKSSYDIGTKMNALDILSFGMQGKKTPLKELRSLMHVLVQDFDFLAPVLCLTMQNYCAICANGFSLLANELIDVVRLAYVKFISSSNTILNESIVKNTELFRSMNVSNEALYSLFNGETLHDVVAKIIDINLRDPTFFDDVDRFPPIFGIAQVCVRADCVVISNERAELLLNAVSRSLRIGCSDENAIAVLSLASDIACRSVEGCDPSKGSKSLGSSKVIGVVHGSLVSNASTTTTTTSSPQTCAWVINNTKNVQVFPQMTLPMILRGLLEAANEYFPAQLLSDIAACIWSLAKSVGTVNFRQALYIALGDENDLFPRQSVTQKFKQGFVDDISSDATLQNVRNFKRSIKKFVGGKRSAAGG